MTIGDSSAPATVGTIQKKRENPQAVHDAAQQFEAFLIAQMLRSVRESGGTEQSTGSDSASASALGMAEDAFAKALSQRGGLGLSRLVESGIERAHTAENSPKTQKLSE